MDFETVCTSNIPESDKPSKSKRPKAKTLSHGERRRMMRQMIDISQQNEFDFASQPPQLKPEPGTRNGGGDERRVGARPSGPGRRGRRRRKFVFFPAARAEFKVGKEGKQEFEEELERYLESREDTKDTLERTLFRNPSTSAHIHTISTIRPMAATTAYGYWTH